MAMTGPQDGDGEMLGDHTDDRVVTDKLRGRIAELEAARGAIKRYNAACRRGDADPSTLSPELQRELEQAISEGQCPAGTFPGYVLVNLRQSTCRARKQLAQLESQAPTELASNDPLPQAIQADIERAARESRMVPAEGWREG
jgi:hypothetical protein